MSGPELKELVPISDGIIFRWEEEMPIFCKPKLLPMKTITTEKLEQMQKEAERLVMQTQQPETINEEGADQNSANEGGEKTTEVWTADD